MTIELKFSQVCYFMHMLRYTKWEDWSLTITNNALSSVFKSIQINIYENITNRVWLSDAISQVHSHEEKNLKKG